MIQPYLFPSTRDKPQIILDPYNGIFEISGQSFPGNVNVFYDPVISWLEKYAQNPNSETIFHMKLDYFNSSSAKKIIDMILIFEEIFNNGYDAKIVWHYKKDDDALRERGEDIKIALDIPFELREF